MRRARHKLQISTFPFLAVLLGAMGSLIFLLLVMDQRAKIVARNKVREAQSARQASATEVERVRAEDWERQRRQLHETLAAQDQLLRGQLQGTLNTVQQSSQQLEAHSAAQLALQSKVDAELQKLVRERDELRQRQTALMQSTQVVDASKTDLARLTRDLLEMEQTLDGLKRLKSQQRPTYSLVPYRGQRGGNRMPIYVECTHAGLTFLPDGQRLGGTDLDLPLIRSEVERRHGPLVKTKRLNPFQPDPEADQPYVLFLIRPDGIGSYYRGQSALRGFQIDFGYELVDAEWQLDVPMHPALKSFVQGPFVDRATAPRLLQPIPGQASAGGNVGVSASSNDRGTPGVPAGIESEQPGAAATRPAIGFPGAALGGPMNNAGNNPRGVAAGPNALPAGNGSSGPSIGVGAPSLGSPMPSAPNGTGGPPTKPGEPASIVFRPAQVKGAPWSPLDGPAPGVKAPGSVATGTGQNSDAASAKKQATAPNQGASSASGGAPPPPGEAINRLSLPSPTAQKQPKSAPPPLSRVIGNRDFIVTIACYGEGVQLAPGGASFQWKGKTDAETDEAMVRAVVELVRRRQATVSAGEPPYRAVLRFEVHEQGRRTYHRVFPLLENLRLPMVREDVED